MALRQRGTTGRTASVTIIVIIICNCTREREGHTDTNAMIRMGRETLVLDIGDMVVG